MLRFVKRLYRLVMAGFFLLILYREHRINQLRHYDRGENSVSQASEDAGSM